MKTPKRKTRIVGTGTKSCPVFEVGLCCGSLDCPLMKILIHNPVIEEIDGKLTPTAYFPLAHAQELIDKIRSFAAAKGFPVK